MKKYCWIYFRGGYGLMDTECVFLDHKKALEYVVDYLVERNPALYKDMPLTDLYMEANSDLWKVELKE